MEESLYLLIPLSVVLVFGIALVFRWSVRSGQFDDLEGPAFRILMDDDKPSPKNAENQAKKEADAETNAQKAWRG